VKWLLDADVLSQPAKRHGDARVIAWLEAQKEQRHTAQGDPPREETSTA